MKTERPSASVLLSMNEAHPHAPPTPLGPGTWTILFLALLLGVVTFVVFTPVLKHEFLIYDDPDFVTANPNVQRGFTRETVTWAFKSLFIYWQPLTWISYMADHHFWGLDPRGFHLTNLVLHTLNTLLLFGVLTRMTHSAWSSACVAALFALHPLHVETVAWISERKGVLSTFFFLLAIWAYLRYVERPGWIRYLLLILFFACGLMSKSMVVTLPCVLLLLDFWPLRRLRIGPPSLPVPPNVHGPVGLAHLLLEKAPLLGMSIFSGAITLVAQQQSAAVFSLEQLPLKDRFAHAALGYLAYLRKTFWPVDLAVFYPLPESVPAQEVTIAYAVLGGVTLFALILMFRAPWLLVGWLWFIGTMLPVSGLLQTGDQAMADRYTYIPLIGLFIAVVWSVARLFRNARPAWLWLRLPAAGAIGACIVLTGIQVKHWANTRALSQQAVNVTSRNYVAHALLAQTYAEEGKMEEARRHYAEALSIKPTYGDAQFGFANALAENGDLPEAIEHYQKAVALKPRFPDARYGLGLALLRAGNAEEAVAELDAALQLNPAHLRAQAARAIALQTLGRTEEAATAYALAAQLDAGAPSTYLAFGHFLLSQGWIPQAVPAYQEVLKREPDSIEALSRLAWIYATYDNEAVRNGAEAVRLATRACELTDHKDPLPVNTLAAAYAETGQFPLAVETAQRALELANQTGQTRIVPIIESLIQLYKSGKPCRE